MRTIEHVLIAAAITCGLGACNTMDVRKAKPSQPVGLVCIVHNPAVAVQDFVDVLQAGFARHGLQSQVVNGAAGPTCDASLTYTAERSWDFVPYLSLAELHLWQNNVEIGRVFYRHRNGFSLIKWSGTDTKMDPLIDELLGGVTAKPATNAAQVPTQDQGNPPLKSDCKSCSQIGRGL